MTPPSPVSPEPEAVRTHDLEAVRTHVRGVLSLLNEQVGDLNVAGGKSAAELQQVRAQRATWEQERAEQARAGELGPEWQAIQERVDRGETSVRAVVTGTDRSADSAVLQDRISHRMTQLRGEVEEQAGRDAPGEGVNAAAAATAELLALLQDVRSMKRPMQF